MQESSRRGTRIAHIGLAVRNLDDSTAFYRDVLGLGDVPMDDSDGAKIVGLAAGPSLIELLEAESPESPIAKFVAKRGPAAANDDRPKADAKPAETSGGVSPDGDTG